MTTKLSRRENIIASLVIGGIMALVLAAVACLLGWIGNANDIHVLVNVRDVLLWLAFLSVVVGIEGAIDDPMLIIPVDIIIAVGLAYISFATTGWVSDAANLLVWSMAGVVIGWTVKVFWRRYVDPGRPSHG